MTCARFSPVKPTVFATGSMDGSVYIYDLFLGSSSPAYTLDPSQSPVQGRSPGTAEGVAPGITHIAFNPVHRNLLVCCDVSGRAHLWKLNPFLSTRQSAADSPARSHEQDLQSLRAFSSSGASEAE